MKIKRVFSRLNYLRGLALAALAAAFLLTGCSSGGGDNNVSDSDDYDLAEAEELSTDEFPEVIADEEPALEETAEDTTEEFETPQENSDEDEVAEYADEDDAIGSEEAEPEEQTGESVIKDLPPEDAEPDAEIETVPKLCAPGDRMCYAEGKVMYCSDDGGAWLRNYCGDESVCSNGECASLICAQGEKSCDGKFALACAGGIRFDVAAVCSADETCEAGECKNRCADAEEIFAGSVVLSTTEKLGSVFEVSSKCWNATSGEVKYNGPQKVFKIALQKGASIKFTVTSKTRHFDPSIYIMDECSPTAPKCVSGSDVCCAANAEELVFTAPKDGTYYVAVDEWEGLSGDFELSAVEAAAVSAQISATDATATYNSSTKVAVFGATLKNLGSLPLPWIEVGLYINRETPPVPGTDKPDQTLTFYGLKAGETKAVSFTYNRPANGAYNAYIAVDPNLRIYQDDVSDDVAGPAVLTVINGLNDSPVELPTQFENRIQAVGEASYFSFACETGEIVGAKVSTFDGSQFLPSLSAISPNRTAAIITKNAGKPEDLPLFVAFKCSETGAFLLKVAASSLASSANQRAGSYTLTVAKLESFKLSPSEVAVFPGRSATLALTGHWQRYFIPDGPLDPSLLTFKSFNETSVKVDAAGKITALDAAPQGFATIAALNASGKLASSYCAVQVTHIIPGLIYASDDHFPRNIPDMGTITSAVYVSNPATIKQIFVGISVTHPDISGLKIKLKSPDGREITLLSSYVSQKNLATVYGLFERPDGPGKLEDFVGLNPKGVWTLTVSDSEVLNTGRLNNWRLYILHNR